ncbi:MAG: hypothetical protein CMJ75_21565 [Planctomycetaceae bacterium]|nr:hypothetical protein [Planctomycetaceae bacterium]
MLLNVDVDSTRRRYHESFRNRHVYWGVGPRYLGTWSLHGENDRLGKVVRDSDLLKSDAASSEETSLRGVCDPA